MMELYLRLPMQYHTMMELPLHVILRQPHSTSPSPIAKRTTIFLRNKYFVEVLRDVLRDVSRDLSDEVCVCV